MVIGLGLVRVWCKIFGVRRASVVMWVGLGGGRTREGKGEWRSEEERRRVRSRW